jgi:hypothetical protein
VGLLSILLLRGDDKGLGGPDEANGKTGPQTNSIWCDEMLADVVAIENME